MKFGYDWRSLRQTETNKGWRGGIYGFDSSYTRSSATAPGQYGQGIASFMLGLPTNNSFIEVRPEYRLRGDSATASSSTTTGASPTS